MKAKNVSKRGLWNGTRIVEPGETAEFGKEWAAAYKKDGRIKATSAPRKSSKQKAEIVEDGGQTDFI